MTFWQKHKWKILAPVLIVLVLAAAFIFGDRNMPKQKDPLAQPTVAAPVETPAQNAAESNTPDKVETEPTQTPTENVSEPSDDPQVDKPARTDTEPPEYLSPEEIQASATGEYEEVGGMMIDTGTGKDKYFVGTPTMAGHCVSKQIGRHDAACQGCPLCVSRSPEARYLRVFARAVRVS